MSKTFMDEVRQYCDNHRYTGIEKRMAEKLVAIDDLIKASKHGFASELQEEIRQILEGESK